MSLVTQINGVLTRIGTEFKSVRSSIGDLSTLLTSDKSSVVSAINEAISTASPGATNLSTTLSPTQTIILSDTGADATIPAADTVNAGVMTKTMFDKLSGIAAGADVTAAANVDAAGAVMNSDTTVAAMGFVIDEDNFSSNLDTKVPTQQSTKAYIASQISALVNGSGAALDTLKELADALGGDANFSTTISDALGLRVRVDAAQTFNGTQLTQGQDNLSVYSRSQIGDPATDFVAVFVAALA